jgi:hypothetical protein
MRTALIDERAPTRFALEDVRVSSGIAREIASAYFESSNVPSSLARAAYAQLTLETDRIFAAMTAPDRPDRVRVRFTRCAVPYMSAEELMTSVNVDKLLEVTAAACDLDRTHPLMDCNMGGTFDRFRAVHDLVGHSRLRAGFDRDAEYAVWRFQERFHSGLACRALATELHAKHSVRWTTGESPDHRVVMLDPRLVHRSRLYGSNATRSVRESPVVGD